MKYPGEDPVEALGIAARLQALCDRLGPSPVRVRHDSILWCEVCQIEWSHQKLIWLDRKRVETPKDEEISVEMCDRCFEYFPGKCEDYQ